MNTYRLAALSHIKYTEARNARYLHFLEPKVRIELQYDRPEVRLKSPTLKIKITLDMHEKLQKLQDTPLSALKVFKRTQPEAIVCAEGIEMIYEWQKMHNGVLPVTLHFPQGHENVTDDYN